MSLSRCLVAARARRPDAEALIARRLDSLARLYGRVGAVSVQSRSVPSLGLVLAVLHVNGDAGDEESWGNALPPGVDLLRASDAELRALPTPLAAAAAGEDEAVVVTAPGGITSLYAAEGDAVQAWSSHAVAASWLAAGGAAVDWQAAAELVTWEFVGSDSSLVAGVRAVDQATRITLTPSGAQERSYWRMAERWAPLPPEGAREEAPATLLGALERQLAGASAPVLGLTGGVDSRTLAVGLRELGIPFSTFTFVADAASVEDAAASGDVANALSAPHSIAGIELRAPGEVLAAAEADALWNEGGAPLGLGTIPWPDDMSHWVVGVGAEVGRSFYYRWVRPGAAEPSPSLLRRVLASDMALDLGGADAEVRRRLRVRMERWIEEARDAGHRGWSALDVVYGEQRVRRWARGMAPRLPGAFVPGFASQGVMRLLASLPLEDRLSDGFARRFIAAHAPELGLAPAASSGAALRPLRRRRAVLALRELRRRLGLPALGRTRGEWRGQAPWDTRGNVVEWLADGVLASPSIAEAMGRSWQREVRANFLRGEPHAAYLASWAAAPVALEQALRR